MNMTPAVSTSPITFDTTPDSVEVNACCAPMHVVVEPADQRAGLGAGEERERHPLHVVEHPACAGRR